MRKIFFLLTAMFMAVTVYADTRTIYCKADKSWWKYDTDGTDGVAAYAWNASDNTKKNAEWPGTPMEVVADESDIYSIELDEQYDMVIFTRVHGTAHRCIKTADLTIPTDGKNMYTITRASFNWDSDDCALTESDGEWGVYTAPTNITYYFVNTYKWESVHAYAWDPVIATWPGEEADVQLGVSKNGYNVWAYTMKSNRAHVIFNDGTGGDGHQTATLDIEEGKPYSYKGQWYASLAAIPDNTLADGFYLKKTTVELENLTAALKFGEADGNGERTLVTALADGDLFKVVEVSDDAIVGWYPDEINKEYPVDADHAGAAKTVYFRQADYDGAGWWYKHIYVEKNWPTAVDNTEVGGKAVKVIRDGQLLIVKDGKTFNVLGTVVR